MDCLCLIESARGEIKWFLPVGLARSTNAYLDKETGDVTMTKIQEFALDSPAAVLTSSLTQGSIFTHQDRARLRKQCEDDLQRYLGDVRITREGNKDNDAYDE